VAPGAPEVPANSFSFASRKNRDIMKPLSYDAPMAAVDESATHPLF
jgi:hypothetical protein